MTRAASHRLTIALGLFMAASVAAAGPASAPYDELDEAALTQIERGLRALQMEDFGMALRLLRRPAEAGNAVAQRYLGILYLDGLGMPPDPETGLAWLEKSYVQGDLDAGYEIGVAYFLGKATEKDQQRAFEYFKAAAEGGHEAAALNLARLYRDGVGAPRDRRLAVRWFLAAGRSGHPTAMRELGILTEKEHPTEEGLLLAYMWLLRARWAGNEEAGEDLARIGVRISPEQRQRAEAFAHAVPLLMPPEGDATSARRLP